MQVILDNVGPNIWHHSSVLVKTCDILGIRNQDFLVFIPHIGLKVHCHRDYLSRSSRETGLGAGERKT